jgi:hypothetical protein
MAYVKNLGFVAQLRSDASNYVIRYRSGDVRQSGRGLVFWFRPETASIAGLGAAHRKGCVFPLVEADRGDPLINKAREQL